MGAREPGPPVNVSSSSGTPPPQPKRLEKRLGSLRNLRRADLFEAGDLAEAILKGE